MRRCNCICYSTYSHEGNGNKWDIKVAVNHEWQLMIQAAVLCWHGYGGYRVSTRRWSYCPRDRGKLRARTRDHVSVSLTQTLVYHRLDRGFDLHEHVPRWSHGMPGHCFLAACGIYDYFPFGVVLRVETSNNAQ